MWQHISKHLPSENLDPIIVLIALIIARFLSKERQTANRLDLPIKIRSERRKPCQDLDTVTVTDQFLEAHFWRLSGVCVCVCVVLLNVWLMNYNLDRSGVAQGYTHGIDHRSFNTIVFVGASFLHESCV